MFGKSLISAILGPFPGLTQPVAVPASALPTLPHAGQAAGIAQGPVTLGSDVEEILRNKPMIEKDDVPADEFRPFEGPLPLKIDQDLGAIRSQSLFFPRLEGIHLLLCGERPPTHVTAIENGVGIWPHTAALLLGLGCRVMIKEPDSQSHAVHFRHMRQHYAAEIEGGRLEYAHDLVDVNTPTDADIVYWTSPSPRMIDHYGEEILFDYLGRDVVVGGFLVLQLDWPYYDRIKVDTGRWEPIVSVIIGETSRFRGLVMATTQEGHEHYFKVFRRIKY